ncbi:MAG: fumarylacetoacetate hydrolase family protein, partial [Enterobacteriaceae bacterium]
MRQARILHNQHCLQVVINEQEQAITQEGTLLPAGSFTWLPPVERGTLFALGLNYADHAAELEFKAPEEPLIFLKAANTLTGHQSV